MREPAVVICLHYLEGDLVILAFKDPEGFRVLGGITLTSLGST